MPSKRIILMYITEVSGHHSATLAIEKAILKLSPGTEILNINVFHYTNPISEKVINRLYMGVIKRMPQIWDYLYDNPTIVKGVEKIKDTIHKFNSPKLKNLFEQFKPDVVACTQAFPCGMVADFKKTYNSNIPLVAVLTDYIPHSYWIYETIDYFVAPSEEVAVRLTQKGIPSKKIKSFGIPFDIKFNEEIDKDKVRESLKLNHLPTLLIMGGGHGLGPIKTVLESLEKIDRDFQEIVVAGANKKLYNSLSRSIKKYKKTIRLLGYVNNIQELMGISDIILTKPGGITTAEALAKKIPMIIINPLPGQEISNTHYLTEKGAAVKVDNLKDLNVIAEDLLFNPVKLDSLRECAGRISKPNASLDIANLLLNL